MNRKALGILIGAGIAAWLLWDSVDSPRSSKTSDQKAREGNVAPTRPGPIDSTRSEGDVEVPSDDPWMEKLTAILAEEDDRTIPGFVADLLGDASLSEVKSLLALAESEPNFSQGFRDEIRVAAYERWFALDPATAIREMDASALSAGRKRSRLEVLIEDWANREPQEVAAFLEQSQLNGLSSDLSYGALARGSASQGDRALIEDALSQISDPKLRNFALKSVARTLQRDHEALFESWASSLPANEQGMALAEGAWMLADTDIDQSLQLLDRLADLGPEKLPVTRSRVLVKWTRSDPASAGRWVLAEELPTGEREDLFALFLRVWSADDPGQATAWVEASVERGELDEAFLSRVAAK